MPRILQAILLAAIAYPTTKIRVNATCRKCPHKVHRMEMKTAISCTRSEERFSRNAETDLVCRLLLEKKKIISKRRISGMTLLILALLQRIFLMSSLLLYLVWLIFFFVLRNLVPLLLNSFPTRRSSDLIAYPTTKIRVNATCRKCPHKVHRMEMKTAISCTILRHTKILIAVGV